MPSSGSLMMALLCVCNRRSLAVEVGLVPSWIEQTVAENLKLTDKTHTNGG